MSVDGAFVDMLDQFFGDSRASTRLVPAGHVDRDLWQQLDDLGLARLTATGASGGSGASWAEAAALLRAAAFHMTPLPLVENDLLAIWLLETAGVSVTDAAIRTVAVFDDDDSTPDVPWVLAADSLVLLLRRDADWTVHDMPFADFDVTASSALIGVPRHSVRVDRSRLGAGMPVDSWIRDAFQLRGALARAVQISGALDRALELCVQHCTSRVQFGRPIGRFQAVQHMVADIALEGAISRAACESAVAAMAAPDMDVADLEFEVAVARSVTNHAVSTVVRNAHQVHGAIGATLEHDLHRVANAALDWRRDFGSVSYSDAVVARHAVRAGRNGLWPLVTGGPTHAPSPDGEAPIGEPTRSMHHG